MPGLFDAIRMRLLVAYITSVVKDPLFARACMFLWGVPFAALGFGVMFLWGEVPQGWEWLGLLLLLLVGFLGLYLMYVAVAGSLETLARAAGFTADGGEWLGLVLALVIVVVALPVTALIRAVHPRRP